MLLRTGAAALGFTLVDWFKPAAHAAPNTKKVLFFCKSSGFEHSTIARKNGEPSFAEKLLAEVGPKHNIEFTFSKDGSLFNPQYLGQFDAFYFHTTGWLTQAGTDKQPPMTHEGKAAFLDAIKAGKGFIGSHCATDTFHTAEESGEGKDRYVLHGDKADPYIQMIGGEFLSHGAQQKDKMTVIDKNFPGMKAAGDSFEFNEEWYSLKEFAPNLHVLLVQDTSTMKGAMYQRPPYPATWARMHGKGRVFYTSMGHREDVWTSPIFQDILFGGIAWAMHNIDADVTPNLKMVTPDCDTLPPKK